MIIIAFLLLEIFAGFLGVIEAVLFMRQGSETFKWNIHKLFTTQRCELLAIMGIGMFINFVDFIFLAMAFVFGFSFIHNWAFGYTKLWIKKLKPTIWQGMRYESPDDHAENKYDFNSRMWMFLTSLVIVAIGFIIKYL